MNSSLKHIRIGTIRTLFLPPDNAPRQTIDARGTRGRVELLPEYVRGLDDLAGFSYIYLIFHMHMTSDYCLRVILSVGRKSRGIFATRSPLRPNPLGLSLVQLDRIEGSVLHIGDIDIVDGTPLLDLKPYIPALDRRRRAKLGWLDRDFTDPSEGGRWW